MGQNNWEVQGTKESAGGKGSTGMCSETQTKKIDGGKLFMTYYYIATKIKLILKSCPSNSTVSVLLVDV